jgi:hypothetical protein
LGRARRRLLRLRRAGVDWVRGCGRGGGVRTDAPQIARRRRCEDGRVPREWRAGDGGETAA